MEPAPALPADAYDGRWTPALYDGLIAAMFSPLGGVGRMRDQALASMGRLEGQRVLELGCGTGALTRRLTDRGAKVTAVDGSLTMLARAGKRAPAATFVHARLEALGHLGQFDHVLCAFVLHELPAQARKLALAASGDMLCADGRLTILDHAVPTGGAFAQAWRGFLSRLEPPSVAECIGGGYAQDLREGGYEVVARSSLARGCAQLIVARPAG
jgi:ubiquinone/menaquinone biosynthesis C-methylase UbiE